MEEKTKRLLVGDACFGGQLDGVAVASKNQSEEFRGRPALQVSLVQGPPEGINSQWQAGFLQIFPFDYLELPYHHETDEAFFRKYWRGGPAEMTFEEFLEYSGASHF